MTEKVTCPRCNRIRKTGRIAIPEGSRRAVCKTCRMLESVEDHRRAIARLYEQIMARRMRGL